MSIKILNFFSQHHRQIPCDMHLQMASNQTTNRHILQLLNWHISRAVHKHSAYTADPATKKQQTSYIRCFKRNYLQWSQGGLFNRNGHKSMISNVRKSEKCRREKEKPVQQVKNIITDFLLLNCPSYTLAARNDLRNALTQTSHLKLDQWWRVTLLAEVSWTLSSV